MLRTCELSQRIITGRNFWSKMLLPGRNIFFHNLPNHFNVVVKFKPGQMRMRVDESWQSWDVV